MSAVTVPTEPIEAAEIGPALRAARTARNLSVEDLQARTRINARYLEALEEEHLEALPPFPFAAGYLRLLARELDLEPEPLVERLRTRMVGASDPFHEDLRRLEVPVVHRSAARRTRRAARWVGIGMAVVAGALAVVFAYPRPAIRTPIAVPEVASPASPTTTPGAGGPSPRGVTLALHASGRSWVLVTAEEGVLFQGFVTAGQGRQWSSRGPITVRLGNAGAVAVTVNGRSVGTLGRAGEVVSRTFPGAGPP